MSAPEFFAARRLLSGPMGAGLLLGLFALGTATTLALTDAVTRAPIAARAAEDLQASLSQVLTAPHDNDPAATPRPIADPVEGVLTVYLSTQGSAVTGLAYELTGYGYGGAIRVLIGVLPDGSLSGVRVLSHAETPGLGDKIEAAKSAWVLDFTGRSLSRTGEDKWKIQRDGGVFDQFSGASITPRAVVGTVQRGLMLFDRNRDALLAPVKEAD